MIRLITAAIGLAIVLASSTSAQERMIFTVGSASAARGQKAIGMIEVPAGSDAATSIPVAVFHGAKPGPTLALVSGAHGTESEQTGVFYPLVQRGTYVEQGMKIGYVTDYLGKTIFEARAPA